MHKTVDEAVALVNVDVQDESTSLVDLDSLCISIENSRPIESFASNPGAVRGKVLVLILVIDC